MNAKLTAPKLKLPKLDFQEIAEDFRTLDPQDPGLWPLIPRVIILAGLFVGLLIVAWWFGWNSQMGELDVAHQQEEQLREEWVNKKRQAVNLDAHRRQLAEINRTFGALLKQLPNASEVENLLVDINQAGIGHGLQFDLFQPQAEVRRDFYAELPIKIRIVGSYHELGSFVGDIAKLSRIVTLNDIDISVAKDATLTMNTVAKTFRYLDDDEMAQQRKAEAKGKK